MTASVDDGGKFLQCVPPYLSCVLRQLDHLGWDRVEHLSDDLLLVTIVLRSPDHHLRLLRLQLTSSFPLEPPIVLSADVPEFKASSFSAEWDESTSRIADIVNLCENNLEAFASCLRVLASIDEECVVIDPRPVLGTEMHRRIALDGNLSMHLLLSPECMPVPKEVKFLGPEQKAKELKSKYMEHQDEYDCSKPLLDNLEIMLRLEIPSQPSLNTQCHDSSASQSKRDCCICFSYNLDSEEDPSAVVHPDMFCEDERCARPYHRLCLWRALISNRESKSTVNGIIGKCVYCKADIWCSVPD